MSFKQKKIPDNSNSVGPLDAPQNPLPYIFSSGFILLLFASILIYKMIPVLKFSNSIIVYLILQPFHSSETW